MAKKKKEPTTWEIAKPFLEKDILEGKVTQMMFPRHVKLLRPEYQACGTTFGQNYRNLQKNIQNKKSRAAVDDNALKNDRSIFPICVENRWDGSRAQRLLKFDVNLGAHIGKTPTQFWGTRSEYKAWHLNIFRPHIYQEVRSKGEILYWLTKKCKKRQIAENDDIEGHEIEFSMDMT